MGCLPRDPNLSMDVTSEQPHAYLLKNLSISESTESLQPTFLSSHIDADLENCPVTTTTITYDGSGRPIIERTIVYPRNSSRTQHSQSSTSHPTSTPRTPQPSAPQPSATSVPTFEKNHPKDDDSPPSYGEAMSFPYSHQKK